MRIKELVARVQGSISGYKGDITETLSPSAFLESQESLKELHEVLMKHASDETIIDSEDVLLPFIEFLRKRWEKIAGSESSYRVVPKSRINLQCKALELHMILACQQFHYKNRERNTWLMPELPMSVVAKEILRDIGMLSKNKPENEDSDVYLESLRTLDDLKTLATSFLESSAPVSVAELAPFINFLKLRWERIQGTSADYRVNTSSDANVVCQFMAGYLCRAIDFNNRDKEGKIDPQSFLMPITNQAFVMENTGHRLRDEIFATLKQEETVDDDKKRLTTLLARSSMDMRVFAMQLLKALDKLQQDNLQELDLVVYLESKRTLQKLRVLLEKYSSSSEPITDKTLAPFIDFLKNRWDIIDGTKASYPANTSANQACILLADRLSLAGYQINYLNRNQLRLLQPVPHHGLNKESANINLRLSVISDMGNVDDLLREMSELDQSKWKELVSSFDLESLVKVITKGKTSLDDVLQINDIYTQDEARSKKLLFALFEIYIKDRSKIEGDHKTMVGSIVAFTHFVKVPTGTEKIAAANEIQRLILGGVSLASILADINNQESELYKKHHYSLNDSTLKKFVAQLERAVAVLPGAQQKITQEYVPALDCK